MPLRPQESKGITELAGETDVNYQGEIVMQPHSGVRDFSGVPSSNPVFSDTC